MVTQAREEQESEESPAPPTATEEGTAFDAAVSEFLSYLQGYRHYSPWTVRA